MFFLFKNIFVPTLFNWDIYELRLYVHVGEGVKVINFLYSKLMFSVGACIHVLVISLEKYLLVESYIILS